MTSPAVPRPEAFANYCSERKRKTLASESASFVEHLALVAAAAAAAAFAAVDTMA